MKPPPVPDDHPTILFSRYELGKLLGKGTFAKVYQAKDLTQTPPTTVAIKIINKDNIRRENLAAQILREISVMRLVRHPHVVDLHEVMATKSRIFFVMQLVKGGELFAKVARGRLREDVARKYFQKLISAVDFCHKRGVSHRDLKPENLLLDEEGNLKVSDFGLSSLPEQLRQDGLLHTQCGTPAYVAPEVLRKKGYDGAKADLWSCGVILYVLLAGFLPFQDENLIKMYAKVFKADYKIPTWVSPGARRLISRLLVADPNKRITVPEIMDTPWFKHGLTSPTTELTLTLTSTVDSNSSGPKGAPAFYNAFEFISAMSPGFDLSGMFESRRKAGTVFTSRRSSGEIVRVLVEVGERLGYEMGRVGEYKVSYGGKKCGCNSGLVVTAEVFEVVDGVAVVEFERRAGNEEDFAKFCQEDVRPGLKEVVWTWQGDCRSKPEVNRCLPES